MGSSEKSLVNSVGRLAKAARRFNKPLYIQSIHLEERERSSLPLLSCGLMLLALAVLLPDAFAQHRRDRFNADPRADIPDWEVDQRFKHDVFTFARVKYDSFGGRRGGWGRGDWSTDYPDAELNLAYRLQQMTSLKVNPDSAVVVLDEDDLSDYPFLYMVEPGQLTLRATEVEALRNYLLNGGFLMVDDFWGEDEWSVLAYEMSRVFPDRKPIELPIEHPIFHMVFDLKEKPQIPSLYHAVSNRGTGITWERHDAQEVHYKGIFDDQGRLMVIICHNTDLGDGWEREGESEWYFREFAEKKAYPLGINIIVYAMTH